MCWTGILSKYSSGVSSDISEERLVCGTDVQKLYRGNGGIRFCRMIGKIAGEKRSHASIGRIAVRREQTQIGLARGFHDPEGEQPSWRVS